MIDKKLLKILNSLDENDILLENKIQKHNDNIKFLTTLLTSVVDKYHHIIKNTEVASVLLK